MPFRIIDVETAAFCTEVTTVGVRCVEFDTGEQAQSYAKGLAEASTEGRKYRVKRIVDKNWMAREQHKFDRRIYQPLPWAGEGWWCCSEGRVIHQHHFPHVSKKEPGMIAYTESAEKGMDNKRTWIKPSRYLEKYFGDFGEKFGIDIRWYAKQFTAQYEPREVFFAVTEDEIQSVYERGPHSCMSSVEYRRKNGWGYPEKGEWPNDIHACRAYAAGDLQVAYLLEYGNKPKSRVIARALVWPAKKTHSRCYGEEVILKTQLQRLGYTFGAPLGAKLLRMPFNRRFIVPYIDQGDRSGLGALAIKDMKNHLVIVQQTVGTYPANSTSGLSGGKFTADGSQDDGAGFCVVCEEDLDTVRVFTGGAPGDYRHMCPECIDDNSEIFVCECSGGYYVGNLMPRVEMANGETWSGPAFREYGFECAKTGRKYHRRERVSVRVSPTGKSVFWCYAAMKEHAFQCNYTGDWYSNNQKIAMHDGTFWSKQAVNHAGFVCGDCKEGFSVNQRYADYTKTLCTECGAKHGVIKQEKRNNTAKTADDIDASLADILGAALQRAEERR